MKSERVKKTSKVAQVHSEDDAGRLVEKLRAIYALRGSLTNEFKDYDRRREVYCRKMDDTFEELENTWAELKELLRAPWSE